MIGVGREVLLPRDAGGERWLASVIAILCCLACLSTLGGLAANRAAGGWVTALRGEATVQVRPRADQTGDQAAARAAEILSGAPGVDEAAALDRQAAEALLRPWLGDAALADLPLPHLVTVRLDHDAPADAASLKRVLAQAGVDASVDDHSLWRSDVERAARSVAALAFVAFLLTAGAAGAAIAYATRAGMTAQRVIIETLSLNGASDGQIARLYMRRYGLVSLAAGAAGALAAMATGALVRFIGSADGVSAALRLAWSDILWLSPCPLAAATVALVAARTTALARLKGRA